MPHMSDQAFSPERKAKAGALAQRLLDEGGYRDTAWLPVATVKELIAVAILVSVAGVIEYQEKEKS